MREMEILKGLEGGENMAVQFLPYTDLDEYPSVKAKLARG